MNDRALLAITGIPASPHYIVVAFDLLLFQYFDQEEFDFSYYPEAISVVFRWLPELNDMVTNLKTRISSGATTKTSKPPTGLFKSVAAFL